MKKIITLMLTLILGVSIFSQELKVKVGEQFPELKIQSLDGKKVTNLQQFKGKKVLISFTTSWCPTCIQEKIGFQKDYVEKFSKDKNLEVMVIFGNYGKENIDTAQKYMEENRYTFPAYFDGDRKAMTDAGLKTVPTTILLDENGKIIEVSRNYFELTKLN